VHVTTLLSSSACLGDLENHPGMDVPKTALRTDEEEENEEDDEDTE